MIVSPPPRIILTVGLPASGKSTWLARQGLVALSSDALRRLLLDDEDDQTQNRGIFFVLRWLLRKRIELRRPASYVDATHLSPWERSPYIHLGQLHGCDVEALWFDEPLETCLKRNRNRTRVVPEEVMHRMAERFQPPTLGEGFSRIHIVRDGVIRRVLPEL